MNQTNFQANPYHLVEASPYPYLLSFTLLVTVLSGIMIFHGNSDGGVYYITWSIIYTYRIVFMVQRCNS